MERYFRDVPLGDVELSEFVSATDGVTASFVKELARRATVDGDPTQAEPTLAALYESMRAHRETFATYARMLRDVSSNIWTPGMRSGLRIHSPLSVWIELIIVTAWLADRWPDSIGAVRQRAFEAPRRGWAVTCIAPTTAAQPAEWDAATPTLVAARDTLGAALAIVPTTAPSAPPTAEAVLAVLPAEK